MSWGAVDETCQGNDWGRGNRCGVPFLLGVMQSGMTWVWVGVGRCGISLCSVLWNDLCMAEVTYILCGMTWCGFALASCYAWCGFLWL